ncbi:MAG: hypothetical protein EPN93_10320 [Spirochaetes bacterium]|nr:MAG: hypothetical protein EPN93_10320 [Spirochaetota bacterium]
MGTGSLRNEPRFRVSLINLNPVERENMMKKPLLILTLMLTGFSCATSDIAVDKSQIKSIKSIAVLPFTTQAAIPADVLREAEAAMKAAVIAAGFRLVERDNMEALLKEKELSMSGITGESAAALGTLLGADALLTGIVNANEETTRPVKDEKTGVVADQKFMRFQVALRLTSVKNGAIVMSMQNLMPERQQDPAFLGYASLAAYRNMTMNGMREDFVKAAGKKK